MKIAESIKVELPGEVAGHTHYGVYLADGYKPECMKLCFIPCSPAGEYLGEQLWSYSLVAGHREYPIFNPFLPTRREEFTKKYMQQLVKNIVKLTAAAYIDETQHKKYEESVVLDYILENNLFSI